MQFVQRLRTVWSWLPAFRAVAETEHLPTAAQELGVVPSSLSRMVKLLEDELGIALFDRAGKGLVLNAAGQALLRAVRDAMRIVDDALGVALADELRGRVGAAAAGELASTVLVPACARLATAYPQLCVSVTIASDEALPGMLMRGDSDVAITSHVPVEPELQVAELATWTRAVYARALASPARCVVVGAPATSAEDGWPTSWERVVAAWAFDERAALALCSHSDLATVAFDHVARSSGSQLVRFAEPAIPSRTLYIVQRKAIGAHRRTDALAAAIREVLPRDPVE